MTGESNVRDCMSVMHALACETRPHCQVMAYGVKFVPSIIRGPVATTIRILPPKSAVARSRNLPTS